MFRKHKPLKVALDCDDVLVPCIELAMQIQNKKLKFDPPMTIDEITAWSPTGTRSDCILECFNNPSFFKKQKPYDGAQDFVRKLCEKAEVYIMTAVPVCAMGVRAEMIKKYFPEISDDHIILTKSKDLVNIDVLLDDAPHNILNSSASFPVVMKRPWNNSLSGMLSVNTYDEFLMLIDTILNRFNEVEVDSSVSNIIAMTGVSGSRKSFIVQKLVETGKFQQPSSYTDRPRRDKNETYNFVTTEEFNELKKNGEILESTVYAGHNYGSSKTMIQKILDSGKNVVIPIDICGALNLKTNFSNVITVFVERDKRKIVEAILKRKCSDEDKVNRIMSIEAEMKNAEICDYILDNNRDIDDVLDELENFLGF